MKRLLLILLITGVAAGVYSQQRPTVSPQLKKISVLSKLTKATQEMKTGSGEMVIPGSNFKSAPMVGDETELMETVYDMQTNACLSNRFYRWNDGTMAAVCTRGLQEPSATGGFPDRGTGYNYFNGIEWGAQPSQRIESVRSGWPTIAPWGNDGEIVMSHNANDLNILRRATKGEGAWEELPTYEGPGGACSPTWPRIVASGENNQYTHLFYNSYNAYMGQESALLYSRSSDGGETWDMQDLILDELGPDYYLGYGGDDYAVTARGNKVALLLASPWYDVFLMVSEDNGETWDRTVIWEHPYPFFDITSQFYSDTMYSPCNSGSVAIDANGMVHVAFPVTRILRDESCEPSTYYQFPYNDGIVYWNENMDAPIPENPDDVHYTLDPNYLDELGYIVGWSQDVNGDGEVSFASSGDPETEIQFAVYRPLGMSTMPTLSINDDGMILLVYTTPTETFMTSNAMYNYRHTWARASMDLGQNWGPFVDLQADNIFHMYDECIYPHLAKNSSADAFHLTYQADNLPGILIDDDEQNEPTTNIMYYSKLMNNLFVGIPDHAAIPSTGVQIKSCYPNPADREAQLTVHTETATSMGLQLFNLTGQLVARIPAESYAPGEHTLLLDVEALKPGVYFYTLTAGSESISSKLIVE